MSADAWPVGARVRVRPEVMVPGVQWVGTVVSKLYRTGGGELVQNVLWDRDGRTTRWAPRQLIGA